MASKIATWKDWESAWAHGVRDFNEGRYWHAHEAWEANWTKLPEPHRSWTQALIQVCGVFVHVEKNRPGPALRLALRSLELMAGAEAHAQLHRTRPALEIPGADDLMLRIAAHLKAGGFDAEFFLSLAHRLKARVKPAPEKG